MFQISLFPAPGPPDPKKGVVKPDYELKAGFIKVFSAFCQWPEDPFSTKSDNPFVVGTLKENKTITYFGKRFSKKFIRGKNVKILHIKSKNYDQISNCHILFIPKLSLKKLRAAIDAVGDNPVLTISDTKGYEEKGVMINMFKLGTKVRFNVNNTVARKNGIMLSSRMLKLAQKVL
ncbi:MAG: YfiR family protein [bacterium]|nr:YfiR family protein [bacterium]